MSITTDASATEQVNHGTGPNSSAPTGIYYCRDCQQSYSRKDGYDRHLRCLIPCQVRGCENSFRYNKLKEYLNHVGTHNKRNRNTGVPGIPRAAIEQYFKATVNELRETYVPCPGGKGKTREATLAGDPGHLTYTGSLIHNSGAWIPGNASHGNPNNMGVVHNTFTGLAPLVSNDGMASMAVEAMGLIPGPEASPAVEASSYVGANSGQHHRIDSTSSDDQASLHLSDASQFEETVGSQIPILQLKISGLEREISVYQYLVRSRTESKQELERKLDLFMDAVSNRAGLPNTHAPVATDVSKHSRSEEWVHVDGPNESFFQQEIEYVDTHGKHDNERVAGVGYDSHLAH